MFEEDLRPTKFGKWFLRIIIPMFLILSTTSKHYPLSFFLMTAVIPAEWFFRYKVKTVVKLLRLRGDLLSLIFVGWWSVIINHEVTSWIGGWRNLPNISLIGDFIHITPAILITFLIWGLLAKKYYYSTGEIFILTGILGIFVEVVGRTIEYHWSLAFSLLMSFFFFICYAWAITFPFWLIDFKKGGDRSKWRYIFAVLFPWLGLFIWSITIREWLKPWILSNLTGGIIP
ncbi:MAG: hypothetical protein ACXQTS_00655 [Candidatus Methanospirareceae archaeon]